MKFEINLPEELFEQPVRDAVSRTVNSVVNERVRVHLDAYKAYVDRQVENYLEKRLSETDIKSELDKAVERIVNEKLEDRY